jgi:hypothetical protein
MSDPSNSVSLQTDIENLPNNSVALLSAVAPIIQAISADNVSATAVIQVESLGSCFHLNGEWANTVPDFLTRVRSYRLKRLSHWVGWRAGDTASMMAQTSGGKAAAALCLVLVELYNQEKAGYILYELSALLLPQEKRVASMRQLGEVVTVLGNKLAAIGFGNHLASQVTRIRQTYFTAGLNVPPRLLEPQTAETTIEFLHCVSKALIEQHSMLYWEGCAGGAQLLSLVMALCPEDTTVAVENEIIHQGSRRSVMMSFVSAAKSAFWMESTLYDGVATGKLPELVISHPELPFDPFSRHLPPLSGRPLGSPRFKWAGGLSDALEIQISSVFSDSSIAIIRQACVNFIARVVSESDHTSSLNPIIIQT